MVELRLDLQFFAGEKTEKATPKKRQDARKKGQVAKSQDINTSVNLIAVFAVLIIMGSFMYKQIVGLMIDFFQNMMLEKITEENVQVMIYEVIKMLGLTLAPILVTAVLAGVLVNIMQVGFLFSTETIQFKLDKLDPIKGAKRIFSLRAIVELLKSILKISIVGMVAFFVLWSRMDEIVVLAHVPISEAIVTIS